MNTNLVASLVENTQEIQTKMTERITRLMENFDEISTVLTRIITAKGLCIYCRARQPDSKNKATQTGIEDEHGSLSWTACFDNEYQIHRSEKNGAGWYPKKSIKEPIRELEVLREKPQ
jgi:hypothetical protein